MKSLKICSLIILAVSFSSCEEFLLEKASKKLAVPSTLTDLQALLDDYGIINSVDPAEGEFAADDFYLLPDVWTARSEQDRAAYIWEPDYSATDINWFATYRVVYYANIVLEHIPSIERSPGNSTEWDNVKGQALFLRAKSFLSIANIWSPAYDEHTSTVDLGIPLRLTADFNIPSERASMANTYGQIVKDLEAAIDLLPVRPAHVLRASRPAAMALLARTFLFMREYEKCLLYADACLKLSGQLMDYNDLDPSPSYPIPQFNVETLYYSVASTINTPGISVSNALVDTVLYDSYALNDLRKSLYFRLNSNGTYSIRGNYSGGALRFTGGATDEVYLMQAECYARLGDAEKAMDVLNYLLAHRFVTGTFIPLTTSNPDAALDYVLLERRKELIFRGLRFPDIKRQNREGAEITCKRILDGKEFTLSPNDLRFALPIPESVIEHAPGVHPNPR